MYMYMDMFDFSPETSYYAYLSARDTPITGVRRACVAPGPLG